MTTYPITPKKVLYIKLGAGGRFASECIEGAKQFLKLSYHKVPHELCSKGDWDAVKNYFHTEESSAMGTATNHSNQIQQFYEESEETLWITFHNDKLWWCYALPEIKINSDGTKTRSVKGKWSDSDIKGEVLNLGRLSGKLTQTQAFRGTICSVKEAPYLLSKINCEQSPELKALEDAKLNLKEKLTEQIAHLNWKDFELLIDLIFRQAGWQRFRQIGKDTKTIDIEFSAVVTGERAATQIKHRADLITFKKYEKEFQKMSHFDKVFFIVCQPTKDLRAHNSGSAIISYFDNDIAELVISAGLIDWVITRTT